VKKVSELSVFFPTFNEEKHIKNTVLAAVKVLRQIAKKWEILIVNDGSTDKTAQIALGLSKNDARIKVITHSPNRGYGASLRSGFYKSKYDWVAFTDSDGQFDFSEITKLLRAKDDLDADVVVGYYLKRSVPLYRKLNSFLWQVVVRVLFGVSVRDIDCGFKLVSRKVLNKIPPLESERGAFISSEFLIKAKKSSFKIVEVAVHHFPATRKGTGARLNVIVRSFIDLFRLWRKLK